MQEQEAIRGVVAAPDRRVRVFFVSIKLSVKSRRTTRRIDFTEVFEIGDNFSAKHAEKVVPGSAREVFPIGHVCERLTQWTVEVRGKFSGEENLKKDFYFPTLRDLISLCLGDKTTTIIDLNCDKKCLNKFVTGLWQWHS
jgi:hypothetical protein